MPLLYRYFRAGYYDTLKHGELKVARVRDLNDPFECELAVRGEMTPERVKSLLLERKKKGTLLPKIQKKYPNLRTERAQERYFVRHIDEFVQNYINAAPHLTNDVTMINRFTLEESLRVVCFSAADTGAKEEILMWSHYANDHKGVRIGFEVPDAVFQRDFREIIYDDERVALDMTLDPESPESQEAFKLALRTKSRSWSYEKEFRMLVHPSTCHSRDVDKKKMEFIRLDLSWVRYVDLGVNCPKPEWEKLSDLNKNGKHGYELRAASTHGTEFRIVYKMV